MPSVADAVTDKAADAASNHVLVLKMSDHAWSCYNLFLTVKGYSRLMGEDEVATIHTLTAYREVMTTIIPQHRGRVVEAVGDNLLAEFPSVVQAVECAVAIQQELQAQNAEFPAHRRMEFRIGINLGDVVVDGERIYGNGVNIAARL
jgi:adenylate cyclase